MKVKINTSKNSTVLMEGSHDTVLIPVKMFM